MQEVYFTVQTRFEWIVMQQQKPSPREVFFFTLGSAFNYIKSEGIATPKFEIIPEFCTVEKTRMKAKFRQLLEGDKAPEDQIVFEVFDYVTARKTQIVVENRMSLSSSSVCFASLQEAYNSIKNKPCSLYFRYGIVIAEDHWKEIDKEWSLINSLQITFKI